MSADDVFQDGGVGVAMMILAACFVAGVATLTVKEYLFPASCGDID